MSSQIGALELGAAQDEPQEETAQSHWIVILIIIVSLLVIVGLIYGVSALRSYYDSATTATPAAHSRCATCNRCTRCAKAAAAN